MEEDLLTLWVGVGALVVVAVIRGVAAVGTRGEVDEDSSDDELTVVVVPIVVGRTGASTDAGTRCEYENVGDEVIE